MRICKNKITDVLRDKYRANPVQVPDSRVQPFESLIASEGNFNLIGHVKYLFAEDFDFPEIKTSKLADQNFERSTAVDIDVGMKILDGFLKAISIPSAVLSLAIKGAKKISFSFQDSYRKYFELTDFGDRIVDFQSSFSLDNPVFSMLEQDDKSICVITDAFVSKQFSIRVDKASSTDFDLDVPVLEDYIANAEIKVGVEKTQKNEVKFSGDEFLSFAFSCLKLTFDSQGKISFDDWVNLKSARSRAADDKEASAIENEYRIMLDRDKARPLMISL